MPHSRPSLLPVLSGLLLVAACRPCPPCETAASAPIDDGSCQEQPLLDDRQRSDGPPALDASEDQLAGDGQQQGAGDQQQGAGDQQQGAGDQQQDVGDQQQDAGDQQQDAGDQQQADRCVPVELEWRQWQIPADLEIQLATTCEYRCTLQGRYDYRYVPDQRGWIGDYFINGAHGLVYWNMLSGAVIVRPRGDMGLNAEGALAVASHARNTIFPGIDLSTLQYDLRSCDEEPCPPWGH